MFLQERGFTMNDISRFIEPEAGTDFSCHDDGVPYDVFVSEAEQKRRDHEMLSARFGPNLTIPANRVRPWPGNARSYEALDYESVSELIVSIKQEGQRIAALVRPIKDAVYSYEVIAGTRRLWAIKYLNEQGYDLPLVALCRHLTEEEAFREADIENRLREDVTNLERGLNYASALNTYYDGRQDKMARALKISKSELSRLLKLAGLPRDVLAAFGAKGVPLLTAPKLADALDNSHRAGHLLAEAREIAARQQEARQRGEAELPGAKVASRLLNAHRKKAGSSTPHCISSKAGRPMISLVSSSKSSINIRVHARSQSSRAELQQALIKLIEDIDDANIYL